MIFCGAGSRALTDRTKKGKLESSKNEFVTSCSLCFFIRLFGQLFKFVKKIEHSFENLLASMRGECYTVKRTNVR